VEERKNWLFNRFIKRYKYVSDSNQDVVQTKKILKKGEFKAPRFSLEDQTIHSWQKKKIIPGKIVQTRMSVADIPAAPKVTPKPVQKEKQVVPSPEPQISTAKPERIENVKAPQPQVDGIAISAEYEARLEKENKEHYDRGFQEGRNNGLAEINTRTEEISQIFDSISQEIDTSRNNFFKEMENVVMDLSIHLAEKIIGDAVTMISDIVKSNVKKCVELLAGTGDVLVKINPADYEVIKELLPNLEKIHEGNYSFILEPDNNISRGGCLIDMSGSIIDGRVETQLSRLKEHMDMLT